MQNHKTENNGEYRNVSIAILEESASNPRKRFNEESLKELAAYVPGHIIRLLCRSSFCGRRRQTAHRGCWCLFSRAHNVCSRDLMSIRCCENPSRLSDSAKPQFLVCPSSIRIVQSCPSGWNGFGPRGVANPKNKRDPTNPRKCAMPFET